MTENKTFYQLTTEEWQLAWETLKPAEIRILFYLRTLYPFGGEITLKVSEIAAKLNLNRCTVSRALSRLADNGWIELESVTLRLINPFPDVTEKSSCNVTEKSPCDVTEKSPCDQKVTPCPPDDVIKKSRDVIKKSHGVIKKSHGVIKKSHPPAETGSGQGFQSPLDLIDKKDLNTREDKIYFSENMSNRPALFYLKRSYPNNRWQNAARYYGYSEAEILAET
jgi:DNA-binding transcriptional ArsR family regulator